MPDPQNDFSIRDDFDQTSAIPCCPESAAQAVASNPDVKSREPGRGGAGTDTSGMRKYGYLPTVGRSLLLRTRIERRRRHESRWKPQRGSGERRFPSTFPVWNCGALQRSTSKTRELKQDPSPSLTLARQRQLQDNYRVRRTPRRKVASRQTHYLRDGRHLCGQTESPRA